MGAFAQPAARRRTGRITGQSAAALRPGRPLQPLSGLLQAWRVAGGSAATARQWNAGTQRSRRAAFSQPLRLNQFLATGRYADMVGAPVAAAVRARPMVERRRRLPRKSGGRRTTGREDPRNKESLWARDLLRAR